MKYLYSVLFSVSFLGLQAQQLDNALLWKISGNGIKKPSYLYGTIHAICDATLEQNVVDAMKKTGQLYLEIDMDDPKMEKSMIAGMNMKDGVTMSSLVSEEDFKIVDEFLSKNVGISAKMVNTIKPSLVGAMLINKVLGCEAKSIEEELMKLSTSEKEQVYGLESIAEQVAVFDAIPYSEQMEELVKTAKDGLKEYETEFQKLMALYQQKNITAMVEASKSSDGIMGKNDDIMLTKRNQNWIPIITEVARFKPTFFGVGAAHLAGENGVIMLLKKAGFVVEAVK